MRMCEPKGDEVTEGWRKLHDNELHQKLLGHQVTESGMGRAFCTCRT